MTGLQYESEMLPRICLSRPRLVRKLLELTRCKLTVICAEAGYGKTTLATEFACTAGLRSEWYHITPADRDVARLAAGLADTLCRLAGGPESSSPRHPTSRRSGSTSASALADVLIQRARSVGPDSALLFLDDYQNIEQEADANLLLQLLIDSSPRPLHFVILSRSEPHFPLARLRARRELATVGMDELAFASDETARYLREESGLDLEDEAIALVQERTEGWAAGIAMVSQSLSYGSRDRVMAVLSDPAISAWAVYDYLAEEVFDTQQPALQDFLVKTSILGLLSAPACNHLLGIQSSQSTLLSLEARGLFTIRFDLSRRMFRYHQLFCEFLRQKLHQRESPESVRQLHLSAARFYEENEEWEESVHHYLRAGEFAKAGQVVEAIGERYALHGYFQTLEYWLKSLPEELTMARPWLLALKGQISELWGRFDEALRLLDRAGRYFQTGNDQHGELWTAGESAFVKFRSGQLQRSIRDLASAIKVAGEGSPLKHWLVGYLATAYREAGMLEASVQACSASLAEQTAVGDAREWARWQSRAIRNLALTQMEMGDLDAARRNADDALAICMGNPVSEYAQGWVLATRGGILWARGEFEEAIEALTKALSLPGHHVGYRRSLIGLWLGNSLRDLGRYSEAEQAYGWSTHGAQLERLFLSTLTHGGQTARAAAFDFHRQYRLSENILLKSTAEIVLSTVLRDCHELAEALEHAREAVGVLKSHGYRLRLASALLHEARIEYDLLHHTEARESLTQALGLAAAGDYHHFFWWDPELIALLCQKAVAEDVHPHYAVELMMRRFGRTSSSIIAPLIHDKRAEVRQRANSILASFAQLPGQGSIDPREEALADCADFGVRDSLARAIADRLISPRGVQILRAKHKLSWRELEVFVEYYLRPAAGSTVAGMTLRHGCADRLSISEDTVRRHVNSIRSKLALSTQTSGKGVLDWAKNEGLLQQIA